MKPVQLAFDDLTGAVGNPLWVQEWEKLEAQAMEKRGEAMMIYNVSAVKGMGTIAQWFINTRIMVGSIAISQAGKRDELLSKVPSKEGNEQVQWIWGGMLIELEQYVIIALKEFHSLSYIFRCMLRSDIQKLGRNPSPKDQAWIQDKRESLQAKIDAFHHQALWFIPSDVASTIHSSSTKTLEAIGFDLEESDEEGFFLDDESEWEEGDVEIPVERVRLALPSSFVGPEKVQMGLGWVAEVEAELQEGQANDALEALQAGLAEKLLRFRTEVKPAKSQKTMVWAWDSIHKADKQIHGAVQCYRLAQSALEGLGASSKLLSWYQEIQKKDLKMSRDVVEENWVGQQSSELPWFWRLDGTWDNNRGEFLKECEYYYIDLWILW